MSKFILNEESSFEHIIGILFSNWTALKLAVEHGTGGSLEVMRLKIIDLIQNIHEILQKSGENPCWLSIFDIIEDVMDVGFDLVLENALVEDLSKHICKLYGEWIQSIDSRKKVINELKRFPIVIPIQDVPVKPIREISKRDSSSSSQEESDTPCDDAWTVVKHI